MNPPLRRRLPRKGTRRRPPTSPHPTSRKDVRPGPFLVAHGLTCPGSRRPPPLHARNARCSGPTQPLPAACAQNRQREDRDGLWERRREGGGEAYTRLAQLAPIAGGSTSEVDRLILDAATGARALTPGELRQVIKHVARAGFDPAPTSNARGLSGISWGGRMLRGSDRITAAERHYLRHVVRRQE